MFMQIEVPEENLRSLMFNIVFVSKNDWIDFIMHYLVKYQERIHFFWKGTLLVGNSKFSEFTAICCDKHCLKSDQNKLCS